MAVSSVSSPGTGTLSSAGIGSGLDVNGIITSIMGVEKQPLLHLQADASAMQTKLSAVGQMQSMVSSFRDALTPLTNASSFAVTSSASSDPTTVTATSDTTAVPGAYSVSVSALA
ncbi:MAG: flagellar hook protein FliD, partial [Burkholderiales bacterium]|nr:flagellar hook protein FliD [Burkholderiales bacterium]